MHRLLSVSTHHRNCLRFGRVINSNQGSFCHESQNILSSDRISYDGVKLLTTDQSLSRLQEAMGECRFLNHISHVRVATVGLSQSRLQPWNELSYYVECLQSPIWVLSSFSSVISGMLVLGRRYLFQGGKTRPQH